MVSHVFGCIFGHVLPCGMPFGDEKSHDMPFEATPLAPSHTVWEQKRKSCGMTSEVKSADSQIFSEKGRCVVQPQQDRCQLMDFWQQRESCGVTCAIFHHSAKREGGWHNLSKEKCQLADFWQKGKLCGTTSRNYLFLCLPVQIKCSHGRGK